MTILNIKNPYNAPVYHEETVESTMEISRRFAQDGKPNGSVITADFQKNGRGRILGRLWQMERGINLPFTILLRISKIEELPSALSLRAGLCVCLAIEDFVPSLKDKVMIKWPNDIIIGSKKIAGILCEVDGEAVHVGIGVNVAQKEFPVSLADKAGSIALAAKIDIEKNERFVLLEKILSHIYKELETPQGKNWKPRIEERLYKRGESVAFIEGEAGSEKKVTGVLCGIDESGQLLIACDGEAAPRSFVTGEIIFSS